MNCQNVNQLQHNCNSRTTKCLLVLPYLDVEQINVSDALIRPLRERYRFVNLSCHEIMFTRLDFAHNHILPIQDVLFEAWNLFQ